MPPKGMGTSLKEEGELKSCGAHPELERNITDFIFRAERAEVQCRMCNAGLPEERCVWMLARNGVRHLASDEHKSAVEQVKNARRIQEDLDRQRHAAQNVRIRVTQIPAPIAERPSVERGFIHRGDEEEDVEAMHRRLAQQVDVFGLLDPKETAERLGFEGDESIVKELLQIEAEDDFLAEIMANAGLDEQDPADIHANASGIQREANAYFPYPNKTTFLLNILDNMPRLRISSSLMRVFLWMLRESGAKDVPSFDRLRQVQQEIRAEYGIPSIPCKSPLGNVFFINDPRTIIAQGLSLKKDWANPAVRAQMHVYPEILDDGVVREIWHALKWRKNMDLDVLSPMYDAGTEHYYVNELARLKNGDLWCVLSIPARAGLILFETGHAMIDDSKTIIITAADLSENYLDLQDKKLIPQWSTETTNSGHLACMPNPKREIAGGDPLYVTLVDFFGDDVSGNRDTHSNPVRVQDENGKTTRFCIYCNCTPSDNPMQSEICGHIGGKGNKFCRKCHVGGTQEEKTTPEGYHALFEPGEPRTKEHTLTELKKQVELACGGVSKRVQELQTQTGVKDVYTQYWIEVILARAAEMRRQDPDASEAAIKSELIHPFLTLKGLGFDPAVDTPVELLHTILLGAVKYLWHISHTPWSAEKKKTYSIRLQATELMYAGSLIGQQFKTIIQTAVFHLHDLVTEDQFTAWKAVGELSALLWVPEIRDLSRYRNDLEIAVANVLDAVAQIDPSKIMTKIKYHLLTHIDFDAIQLGPLIAMATEIFESFNAVFRYCSIYSNHLAPSRDIAIQFGRQETVKHQLTGGRWMSKSTGDWHAPVRVLVGWTPEKQLKHGDTKLAPLKRGIRTQPVELLKTTNAARALNFGSIAATNIKFDFNTQHDCFSAGCEATGVRPVMQEHVESDKTERFIVHAPLDRFIINTHSFHNPHLVRATVSRDLWAPVALFEDRRVKHDEFSARLRETRATKATSERKPPPVNVRAPPRHRATMTSRNRGPLNGAASPDHSGRGAVVSGSTTIGLAAGRSKRKIKCSARARQAEESESSDSEGDGDGDLMRKSSILAMICRLKTMYRAVVYLFTFTAPATPQLGEKLNFQLVSMFSPAGNLVWTIQLDSIPLAAGNS
ncbi:hypothetical protein B0H10DRAFT_1969390 [Mycena sp. CBHHK59/15]|nr:hypothetical protein B0H10DRAFT_1969390 [Mycena sp. CBHHK59/15]